MIDEHKIVGMLQAKALGCLDVEENKELQEFIDAGHVFPWDELGSYKKAASLFSARLISEKVALILGNEHRGLSTECLDYADRKITIPMTGFVQSLNVSVTAAIFIYEII